MSGYTLIKSDDIALSEKISEQESLQPPRTSRTRCTRAVALIVLLQLVAVGLFALLKPHPALPQLKGPFAHLTPKAANLIYVYQGALPSYAYESLEQVQRATPDNLRVWLILDEAAEANWNGRNWSEDATALTMVPRRMIEDALQIPESWRSREFTRLTTSRFYFIEALMRVAGLPSAYTAELDNLVFIDLAQEQSRMAALYSGLAITADGPSRAIVGFMWIGCVDALAQFNAFIGSKTSGDDMELSSQFLHASTPDVVNTLPVFPPNFATTYRNAVGEQVEAVDQPAYSNHFDQLRMIFDAAALGQYLVGTNGGLDPAGFINEKAVYDWSSTSFVWREAGSDGFTRPYAVIDHVEVPIATVHMHLKAAIHDFVRRPAGTTVAAHAFEAAI